ncbi:Dipeptidyl aminopeptidase/acylaminoacyl peptidase [Sphingomonas laterariae]|uniref:Dipeptidyl aminopeptidase/acylaminoacyl peptidase n=1 Tax=Edaphosphingomonas laterariae TaxID=861865 RepID=A0A239BLS8_9SPHN|nr:S9 family peptidase [Sphingomonas laterariae]SNS08806.1 Dipeptidyl aminopeptidase/acylaminoacyl peptidase [Sphingomonas laterariae]
MKKLSAASLAALAFAVAATPAAARPLTAQDLVGLSRLSDPVVSPDGRWAVWQQRETDLAANKGRTDLWRIDLKAKKAQPERLLADPAVNESAPAFAADGSLWFMSDKSGASEVWRLAPGAAAPEQVTSGDRGISGFQLSPTGSSLLVWADKLPGAPSLEPAMAKKDANAGSGRTYDQLFVRHWDTWADGTRAQLFVLPLANGKATGDGVSLMGGLVGDSPSKPYGGAEEVAWAPDGKTVYFALREAGRIESLSTNLDIFSVPADGSTKPTNLTAGNKGTDNLPAVSPDGKWLAWAAMARAGYEADRMVVHLREIATGKVTVLTEGWDRSVESIAWAPNSASLFVTARDHFDKPIFQIDLAGGKVRRLTGDGSVAGVAINGNGVVYALDSVTAPTDLFAMDEYGKSTKLTAVNAARLAGVDMPEATRFSFAGANGDTVWAYAVKPAGLAKGAKVPLAYIVHGGPQSTLGNAWSYRWNPAVVASAGFGAVFVDFHGSTGYGQAFTDSINKDWGGKPLEDLKKGVVAVQAKFPWIDTANGCALGGSYGGYMMNWIAGQWPDGFKCLVTHAGVFDARAMAYETEELWFDEWEHGGPYFENPAEFEKWNPVNHVTAWKTPMLVIHGEKDFRIPYTQGLAAFTALQRREIPSRLVMFPDENHWILKPKNSLQWYAETLGWMTKWTAKAQ